jgi:hypothetical protein
MTVCCLLSSSLFCFEDHSFVFELRFQELLHRCSFHSCFSLFALLFSSFETVVSMIDSAAAVTGRPAIVASAWAKFQNCLGTEGFRDSSRLGSERVRRRGPTGPIGFKIRDDDISQGCSLGSCGGFRCRNALLAGALQQASAVAAVAERQGSAEVRAAEGEASPPWTNDPPSWQEPCLWRLTRFFRLLSHLSQPARGVSARETIGRRRASKRYHRVSFRCRFQRDAPLNEPPRREEAKLGSRGIGPGAVLDRASFGCQVSIWPISPPLSLVRFSIFRGSCLIGGVSEDVDGRNGERARRRYHWSNFQRNPAGWHFRVRFFQLLSRRDRPPRGRFLRQGRES